MFPDGGPKTFFHEGEEEEICRIKNWEQHIQNLQNDRVYFWQSEAFVTPYHLGSFYTYKEESEWYGEYGELQTAGGDWEEKKSYKTPIEYPSSKLHIAEDFIPRIRRSSKKEKHKIPDNSKIWIDRPKRRMVERIL